MGRLENVKRGKRNVYRQRGGFPECVSAGHNLQAAETFEAFFWCYPPLRGAATSLFFPPFFCGFFNGKHEISPSLFFFLPKAYRRGGFHRMKNRLC